MQKIRARTAEWLRQGVSPRRLALTLALGFAIGCFPIFGLTTGMCAAVALLFRLNMPAIQAANYAALPLQALLIWPFIRLGARILPHGAAPLAVHGSHTAIMMHAGGMAAGALLAWALCAIPATAGLTLALTPLLERIPAFASDKAA